jgi:MFS family permease
LIILSKLSTNSMKQEEAPGDEGEGPAIPEAAALQQAVSAETPLPMIQTMLISSMNLINSASYNSTLPMVPFMVLGFFPGLPDAEIGFYSGLLEGMFHVGSFTGALAWGWFADKYGRRTAMLQGLIGTVLSATLFGFSTNYGMALFCKFLWGALNGNVGVTKTAISELTNETNQARAFSYIGVATGLGRLIGPAMGGLLSSPATRYPSVFGSSWLFTQYPYLLPCLALASLTVLVYIMSFMWLKETLPVGLRRRRADATQAAADRDVELATMPTTSQPQKTRTIASSTEAKDVAEGEVEIAETNEEEHEEQSLIVSSPARVGAAVSPKEPSASRPSHRRGRWNRYYCGAIRCTTARKYFGDHAIRSTVVMYTMISLVSIVVNEIYPLYVLNGPENGGFGWEASEIGLVSTACGPVLMFWQAFIYHRLAVKMGVVKMLKVLLAIGAVQTALTPFCSLTVPLSSTIQWLVLGSHFIASTIIRVSCFTCVFVVVANSALPEDRGKVNGLAQAMASSVRAFAPPVGTALFAWSISEPVKQLGWPFDFSFMWNVLAILSLGCLGVAYCLPKWIERKRMETD